MIFLQNCLNSMRKTIIAICLFLFFLELGKIFCIKKELHTHTFSCENFAENDNLLSIEDYYPNANSIFFHEPSCEGRITKRQACAIESAARAHPARQIYVLLSSPVTEQALGSGNLKMLRTHTNIHFTRVRLEEYVKNTPLEDIYESQWSMEEVDDVLRILTLYKFGGLYLETDILVARPLTPFGENYIGMLNSAHVSRAVLALSMNDTGRKFISAIFKELNAANAPDVFVHNGAAAISTLLQKICETRSATDWVTINCGGIKVYSAEYFYPIYYDRCAVYFQPGELSEDEKKAYAYYLWNKLTYNMTIQKDSPLMKMAAKFCPTIFQMYGDSFGEMGA